MALLGEAPPHDGSGASSLQSLHRNVANLCLSVDARIRTNISCDTDDELVLILLGSDCERGATTRTPAAD